MVVCYLCLVVYVGGEVVDKQVYGEYYVEGEQILDI